MNTKTWKAEHPDDVLMDGMTFADIILMLQCNEKVHNKEVVRKCFKELLARRLEDACEILARNVDFILEQAWREE